MQDSLNGLRVLDLTQGFAGPFGVKQLADQGADVLKVERPDGDPMRHAGPFPGDEAHPEQGGLFLYLNTNRHGVVLDLKDTADLERMHALVARSDLLRAVTALAKRITKWDAQCDVRLHRLMC